MFNRERTKEEFGYDIDPNIRRRTNAEFNSTDQVIKKHLLVVDNCPQCSKERKIKLRSSRKNKICSKCHNNSPEMIIAKQGQNKVKSEEAKAKMSANHFTKRGPANFKGKQHTELAKAQLSKATTEWYLNASPEEKVVRSIKASCSLRGIKVEEFTGWATAENQLKRGSPEYKIFEKDVIERDKVCQFPACLEKRHSVLTVHHKDGFHWCLDRQTDSTNGVLLCHQHHNLFHDTYGRHNNTEVQYDEWIFNVKDGFDAPVKLVILCGVSGAGKSWVSNQLTQQYSYIPFDKTPKEQHVFKIVDTAKTIDKPIIYDPFRKGGTMYRRYKDMWPTKLIVINENAQTVENRIKLRGGTPNPQKVIKAIKNQSTALKMAHFSGTSAEVLEYLKNLKF